MRLNRGTYKRHALLPAPLLNAGSCPPMKSSHCLCPDGAAARAGGQLALPPSYPGLPRPRRCSHRSCVCAQASAGSPGTEGSFRGKGCLTPRGHSCSCLSQEASICPGGQPRLPARAQVPSIFRPRGAILLLFFFLSLPALSSLEYTCVLVSWGGSNRTTNGGP